MTFSESHPLGKCILSSLCSRVKSCIVISVLINPTSSPDSSDKLLIFHYILRLTTARNSSFPERFYSENLEVFKTWVTNISTHHHWKVLKLNSICMTLKNGRLWLWYLQVDTQFYEISKEVQEGGKHCLCVTQFWFAVVCYSVFIINSSV